MADAARANKNKKCKLVVLGDTGVGKTSLIVRFVRDAFRRFEATAGVGTYYKKTIELEDSDVTLNIWDTCGVQRYRSVQCIFLPGASVAVVVYDVTSETSLGGAKYWVEDLQDRYESTMIVLVGNKIDLGLATPIYVEAERYAREHDIVHLGTSAKTSRNVETLFRDIARTLYEPVNYEEDEEQNDDENDDDNVEQDNDDTTTTTTTKRLALALCCSKPKPSGDDEEPTEAEEDDHDDDHEDDDESTTNTTPLLSTAERDADTTTTSTTMTQRWASSLFCFKRKSNPNGQSIQVAQ
eukprot:CAMPEP_0116134268 /NCGR_PEP_ID=MMETSP0329-20121206/10554_1 /TAXON_ID=697910 /ORGANISM="Pseudo-nitzschia arenysensis, Strain B593" /LENGTH=295 /DNA_ID=CAMNT_0003628965 /DNA_START=222 /DNA_END=1109 /DNA_ORIENTATION=+